MQPLRRALGPVLVALVGVGCVGTLSSEPPEVGSIRGRPPNLYPSSYTDDEIMEDMRRSLAVLAGRLPDVRLKGALYLERQLTAAEFIALARRCELAVDDDTVGVGYSLAARDPSSLPSVSAFSGSDTAGDALIPPVLTGNVSYVRLRVGPETTEAGFTDVLLAAAVQPPRPPEPYVVDEASVGVSFAIVTGTAASLNRLLDEEADIRGVGVISEASEDMPFPGWRPYRPGDPLR